MPVLLLLLPLDSADVTAGVGVVLPSSLLSLAAREDGTGSTLWAGVGGGAPAMLVGGAPMAAEAEEEVKMGVEATGGVVESGQV